MTSRYIQALKEIFKIVYFRWKDARADPTKWGVVDANGNILTSDMPIAEIVDRGVEPKSFRQTEITVRLANTTMGTRHKGFSDTDAVYTTDGEFSVNIYYPVIQTERVDSYQFCQALAVFFRDGFIDRASIADADDFGIMFYEPSVAEKMLYADREEIGRKFYRFNAQVRYTFDECPTALSG